MTISQTILLYLGLIIIPFLILVFTNIATQYYVIYLGLLLTIIFIRLNIKKRNSKNVIRIIICIISNFVIWFSLSLAFHSMIELYKKEEGNTSLILAAIIVIILDVIYYERDEIERKIKWKKGEEVRRIEEQYVNRNSPIVKSYDYVEEEEENITVNSLYELDPYEYEVEVAEYLRSIGYLEVDTTPKSGDFGADVIAKSPAGTKMCVQCKRYREGNLVGVKAVQEIYSAKEYYDCQLAYIFTTSGYSRQARELAEKLGVVLLEYK